jgi:hypothetical protein
VDELKNSGWDNDKYQKLLAWYQNQTMKISAKSTASIQTVTSSFPTGNYPN